MKIPKTMFQAPTGLDCYGIRKAAMALETAAVLYRQGGQREAATALVNSAKLLRRLDIKTSFAEVFDFPQPPTVSDRQSVDPAP